MILHHMPGFLNSFYYILAWGTCGAALLFSTIRWRQTREAVQGWFSLNLLGFAVFSLFSSLIPLAPLDADLSHLFNAIPLSTIPLFMIAMPNFAASLGQHRYQNTILVIARILGIAFSPLPLTVLFPPASPLAMIPVQLASTALGACGLYLLVRIRMVWLDQHRGKAAPSPLWAAVCRQFFWLFIILMPLVLINDLFQVPRLLLNWSLPSFMPLFGAGIGGIWLIQALGEIIKPATRQAKAPVSKDAESKPGTLSIQLDGFGLSPREQEVAVLLLEGLSYRGIADRLCISPGTVKSHVLQLYQKTNTRSKLAFLHAVRRS